MLSPATSTVTDPAPLQGTEPATVDLATEGDRESITDVHGTVARFEMSYSPKVGERLMFGPPMRMRIPSFVYLAGAVALLGTVLAAHLGSSNSRLYVWVVEGDKNRPLGALTLSLLILVSAIGTLIRAHMRGVVVVSEGIEARYLMAFGIPRIRKWTWAQVSRLVVDDASVMLELWDGRYERLPEVKEPKRLGELLEGICATRHIHVTRLK